MSNSGLATYSKISPNKSSPRNHEIDTITIHCIVGQWTAKQGCDYFAQTKRQASANYVVGKDGSIGLSVDEADRSWCSSNAANDNRAVTIEVASDTTHPYKVTDAAYSALLDLITDICRRNGIKKLLWQADKSLIGQVDKQNMTVHRWFANKACPGDYLYNLHPQIAAEVNKRLGAESGAAAADEPASTPSESGSDTAAKLETGAKLTLDNVPIYKSSVATAASGTKSGTYWVWSGAEYRGRIRITNAENRVGVAGQVTGWINTADVTGTEQTDNAEAETPTTPTPSETEFPYFVRITASVLNVRSGPGSQYPITTQVRQNYIFTVVAEQDGWGRLKSGAGWIQLALTQKK